MTTDSPDVSGHEAQRSPADANRHKRMSHNAPGDPAARLEYRCRRITTSLRETLGADGASALISRAMATCEPQYPVVKLLGGGDGREIELDGVPAAVARHGLDATEAGVDAMVASLAAILGKLIGEDMTMRLLEIDAAESSRETP